jgi:teichuronic acid biosynthesis glycosyltransferase TuaC
MRLLAVANWDPAVTHIAWADQRLASLRRRGVEVDLLAHPCPQPRDWLRLWRALETRLAREPYDLVAPLYGSMLGLVCALGRVPCALSFAGSDLNGSPDRALSVPLSQLAAVLAAGVSVRSMAMRHALWWPPARRAAHVIPSGVDLSRFSPADRSEARRRRGLPAGPRVLVVNGHGRRREKRIELAEAAVARLPDVTLEVVRDVPFDDMPLVYASSDLLLLTSLKEGSPNCVKEALACALPVVSVDVGDVGEVVAGLTNCAVVPAEPARLGDAIAAALADGRGCPEGPARMAARYSIEAMTEAFVGFYRGVVAFDASRRR